MVMSVQNFIMEAYADPLKYYPPDPANETDTKERRWEILYNTVLYCTCNIFTCKMLY